MTDLTTPAATRGLPVLAAVCLAALILPLNFSAGAVATLAIGRQLGGSAANLAWITNAFMLTFGSSLMAAGALADQFGRKRLFVGGVGALTLLSLALCFASSVLVVDVLRGLQGFAAAAALSGGSAALAQVFHGRSLTRAFSALGTSFGIGLAFGPLLAGVLIGHFGWRSIFLCIAAVGAVALAFGARRMHESRNPDASGLDWPGALTFTAALACFTYAVVQGPANGWNSAPVVGLLCASCVLAAAFVWTELRVARPMLDLSLFRYARFVGVQVLPIGTCYCYIVLLVLLPLRFIGINGMREIDAGLLMLSLSAPMLVVPALAAWLTRWIAPGVLAGSGLLAAAFGLYLLSRVPMTETGQALMLPMLVIGCGTGLPWGLMDGLSMTVVPKDRAGMATGIFSTTRVAGEGIALAIVTAVLATLTQGKLMTTARAASDDTMARAGEAGVQLAAGDLVGAQRIFPELSSGSMIAEFAYAFQTLLLIVAVVTFVAALVTFVCLVPRPGTRTSALAAASDG
ncbi:MFS transporter [Luteibacter rhizovicinus]|uniref:MFS transporter n=1 Tax=Luteibacter rhizovicinus TaxID=242606 RepID=A0A4R3YM06_9GAMM|nr:MFS transporter [Luteibacter rhizovicinus]TCV92084.1 MFS transporter [Luteibacter rhizovicinus]